MRITERCALSLIAGLGWLAGFGCVTTDGDNAGDPPIPVMDAGPLGDAAADGAIIDAAPDPIDAEPDAQAVDMATPDMAPVPFAYPDGLPDPDSLYFRGDCAEGLCDEAPVFDIWHRGPLRRCSLEDGALRLETEPIEGGAVRFTLQFVVEPQPDFDLDPETTQADWTLPDGASAFLWFAQDEIEVRSSGAVRLAECGETIAGTFSLTDLCEYHGCSFAPWITNVEGAFRCTPPVPVPCGP